MTPAVNAYVFQDVPPTPVRLAPELSPIERDELAECERIIERGLAEFVAVGTAISIVRRKLLYRAQYATFEQYVTKRWGVSARQAYRLCDAAEVVRNLTPPGDGFPSFVLPASESQVRPLKELPAEKRKDAWTAAIAESPNGRPTQATVRAVVDRLLGKDDETTEKQPTATAAAGPVIDVQPALTKEARLKEQADKTIRELRELLSLTGTADSQKAAGLQLALEELQDYRDHLVTIGQRAGNRR